MVRLALSCVLAFAASAQSQTCVHESIPDPAVPNQPMQFSVFGGNDNWRLQMIVPGAVFQNVPTTIRELSFGNVGGLHQYSLQSLRIRMAHTSVAQLQTTFAANVTAPLQEVLVANSYVWQLGLGATWVPIGLQQPFQFLPGSGNLLIDIETTGVTNVTLVPGGGWNGSPYLSALRGDAINGVTVPGQLQGAPRLRFCVDRAETMLLGRTCAGSGTSTPLLGVSGRPLPGSSPVIWLSDAPANAPAACAYGFDNAPPFPIDLTPLGAPGCRQYFPVVYADLVLANALGVASRAVAVPAAPATIGAVFYTQYYVLDPPANALDLTASNYARLLVGL